jgi:hypothetical protein
VFDEHTAGCRVLCFERQQPITVAALSSRPRIEDGDRYGYAGSRGR